MTAANHSQPLDRHALIALCAIEFLSWGILYYTLPISATRIGPVLNWSPIVIPTIYTASLLLTAAAAPLVGKLIDDIGPRRVMAAGAVLGALGIAFSTLGQSLVSFTLGWLLVGVAQAATLYPAAFAAAGQWFAQYGPWPLTIITLAGGLSSAAFAPLTAYLIERFGWRQAFLALSIGYGLSVTTIAWRYLTPPWRRPLRTGEVHTQYVRSITRSAAFIRMQTAYAITSMGLYGVTLNLIPLLQERGFGYSTAAALFGAVGAGQLLGRLAFTPFGQRGTYTQRTLAQMGLTSLALFGIALATSPIWWVGAVAVFAGAMRGAQTLAIAYDVSDRWGREAYATIYGHFHMPIAVAMALSPAAIELLAGGAGSYRTAAIIAATATLLALLLARRA
jgi:MFS family permease